MAINRRPHLSAPIFSTLGPCQRKREKNTSCSASLLVPRNFLFLFLINTLDEVLDTFNYSTRPMITTFIFAFSCRWVLAASAPYHRIGFCVFCWCRRSRICLCWYSWAMLWQRNRHSCTTQRRRRLCASPKLLHSPSRSEPTCAMCWCGTMVTTPPTTKPTKLLLNLSFRIDGARRHRNCLFAPNKWN